jgi:hypothetical protein
MKLSLQIALGLIIAAGVIGVFRLAVAAAVLKTAEKELSEMTARMQARAEEQQRVQRVEADRHRKEEQRKQRQVALQEQQRREHERYVRERRAAFDNQYVAPEACATPPTPAALVECANRKMRAREQFFVEYDRARGARL